MEPYATHCRGDQVAEAVEISVDSSTHVSDTTFTPAFSQENLFACGNQVWENSGKDTPSDSTGMNVRQKRTVHEIHRRLLKCLALLDFLST